MIGANKKIIAEVLGIIFLGLISCQNDETKNSNITAIKDVSIIDVEDGTIFPDMTILIKGQTILKIGMKEKVSIPKQSKVIEARGKFVIPGLWDMHAHTSSESVTRRVLYPSFIANGVTGIRVLSADCFEPCWELDMNIGQSRGLQNEVNNGSLIGPRAILGSTYIHGARLGETSTIEAPGNKHDGKELVHLLQERGVDFIKIYDALSRDTYFGIAEEASAQGLTFAGHVPVAIKASEAADVGQKSIEHCCGGSLFEECSTEEQRLREEVAARIQSGEPKNMYSLVLEMVKTYDDAKCQEVFRKFLENNTFYTPTLVASEMDNILRTDDWRKDPRLKYLPKKERGFWDEDEIGTKELLGIQDPLIREKRFEVVGDMNKAGVKLLAGSDCGVFGVHYGFGLHDELELLVEAGLTELEALQTATLNAAEYAERSDSLGNIKEGMLADLVILNTNPLEDIRNTKNIDGVIFIGEYKNRTTLDSILNKVALEAVK